MARKPTKKSPAQLQREIRYALLVADQKIENFLETLDVTPSPDERGLIDDSYSALMEDDKARKRLTAIIRGIEPS